MVARLRIPAKADETLRDVCMQLEAIFAERFEAPRAPVRLPTFNNRSQLPRPGNWVNSLAFVLNEDGSRALFISDGSQWLRFLTDGLTFTDFMIDRDGDNLLTRDGGKLGLRN